jgi:hypothetical protein
MRTMVNEKDFENGKEFYLYLNNYVLDGSGRCDLGITDDLNFAVKQSSKNKIYKVKLEEIELEEVTEQIQIKKKVVSNMLGHRNPPKPPLEKSKDLLKFEWERKQWKEQTRYLYRPKIWPW